MRGFNWLGYVAAAVRNAGWRDRREVQERSHDLVVKLLTGTLFRGFDERVSGPMDLRFRRSVGNAIRNLVEKERNRRHYLPTVPLDRKTEPSGMTGDNGGERVVQGFRRLVKRRLGQLGTAVLDIRLAGGETKSLVGRPDLGSPGKWGVKRAVQQIKQLAREYAAAIGDSDLLRRIMKAMEAESETIEKRRTAMAARAAVGA